MSPNPRLEGTQDKGGYRWLVLGAATFAQASACYLIQGLGPLAGYLQSALSLSTAQVGLLMSAAQLVPVVGFLVAGFLLDRFSERMVVGLGGIIVAVGLAGASLSSSYGSILFWLVIVGAGYSTANPGGSKSVASWFANSQRGFAMGVRQAGLPLGGALAAATLPGIAESLGWQSAFGVGAVVALLGAVAFIGIYRGYRGPMQVEQAPTVPRSSLSAVREILSDIRMKNVVWSGLCLITLQFGFLMFIVLDLRDRLGVALATGASLLFVAQCAGVLGRITLAAWSDRCRAGRYFVVRVSMMALVLGLAALLAVDTTSWLVLAPLAAWLGFFGFGWGGPWIAYLSEAAPRDRVGFALGIAMAINQVAIIGAPPALGAIRDWTGNYITGWALLIVLLFLALGATRKHE